MGSHPGGTAPPPVFARRYQVVRQLARGTTADVYLARDLVLERPVAVKVLLADLATDCGAVERFRTRARANARLAHPNIVPVCDLSLAGPGYFVVMQYVDGPTLHTLLRSRRPTPAAAAQIGAEVAAALEFAHSHGVLHGDLHPGDVLLDGAGQVRVVNFARRGPADRIPGRAGGGPPTRAAAEERPGRPGGLDTSGDVYSLGEALYEMLAGRPPLRAVDPSSLGHRPVRPGPRPPSALNPAVPAGLEMIVLRALAPAPGDRYPSAGTMRTDLLRFAPPRGPAPTVDPIGPGRPPPARPLAELSARRGRPSWHRRTPDRRTVLRP